MSSLKMSDFAALGAIPTPAAPTAAGRESAYAAVESIGYPKAGYQQRCPQLIASFQAQQAKATSLGYTAEAARLGDVVWWLVHYWCEQAAPTPPAQGYVPVTPEQEAILRGGRADPWGPIRRAFGIRYR